MSGSVVTSMLDQITPVILALNEEANIGRCLRRLSWASRVIVLDSGSTDGTRDICVSFPNVEFVHRSFDQHANQWNFAVEMVRTNWVLALDADYMITTQLVEEIRTLSPPSNLAGYSVAFDYIVLGRKLRKSMYPPGIILFRSGVGRYVQDGHTQRIVLQGSVRELRSRAQHDDRKPLSRWLSSQKSYAELELKKMLAQPGGLRFWLRSLVLSPFAVPGFYLFGRRGILDGRAGLFYALQRAIPEILICMLLIASRLSKGDEEDER